jgi:hypothetical protein
LKNSDQILEELILEESKLPDTKAHQNSDQNPWKNFTKNPWSSDSLKDF